MARPSATDRVGRLLAIVPWIADADGPRVADVCDRFGLTRAQLLDDLAVIPFVGRYPYTPENLIEVDIEDGRVWIRYMNFFERPLRLTRDEALALLTAATAAAGAEGHDPDGPLARGLAKVADVLGVDLDDDLRVVLGDVAETTLQDLRAATEAGIVVEIEYYSHARDEHTTRQVEPHRVFHTDGAWYLSAFCRRSRAERVFRLDRITALSTTDEHFSVADDAPGGDAAERDGAAGHGTAGAFLVDGDLDRVVLEVDAAGAWVAEQYPIEAREALADGGLRVTLAVSAAPWLARVLLRLGPHGRVVDGPEALLGLGSRAAHEVLARYRS